MVQVMGLLFVLMPGAFINRESGLDHGVGHLV
jgi:hypothetical protein